MATIRNSVIYVFSGTGNTKVAADLTAKYLKYFGVETDVYSVRSNSDGNFSDIPDPNNYDICGFAYPVHASNVPKVFLDFIKQIPETTGKKVGMKAFIFSTEGGPSALNHVSSRSLVSALRLKGLLTAIDMHMVMPANMGSKVNEIEAKYMRIHTEKMAYMLAYKVRNRIFDNISYNPFLSFISLFPRMERTFAVSNGKKYTVDTEKCIQCNICFNTCPTSNIKEENGYPSFGGRCTMCMGCVSACPAAAIIPGVMDKYKIVGTWDYKALLKDSSITEKGLDSDNAPILKKYKKYYEKTNAEYEELFGDMIRREEAKQRKEERLKNTAAVSDKAEDIQAQEQNEPEEIAYATPVQTLKEKADINATIKLNELKELALEQKKDQEELIDVIVSGNILDDPRD